MSDSVGASHHNRPGPFRSVIPDFFYRESIRLILQREDGSPLKTARMTDRGILVAVANGLLFR